MFNRRHFTATIAMAFVAVLTSGCGSSGLSADGGTASDPVTQGGPLVAGGASSVYLVQNNTYTGTTFNSAAADNILKFSASATGSAVPTSAFSGPQGLFIVGVTTDSAGNIYAAGNDSAGAGQILVYSSTASGTATPIRTIAGSSTTLSKIRGIALDSGQIYVTSYVGLNAVSNSVLVFAANANGNVAPTRTISGSLAALGYPAGIAVDTSGTIFVADNFSRSVVAFNTAASGNVLPTKSLVPLYTPTQITLDASNNIYLSLANASSTYGAINVFPPTVTGNLTSPTRVVGGSALNAAYLMGSALDSKNNIYAVYVSNSGNIGVATFSPTATGNATPASTFTSSAFTGTAFGYIAVR